MTALPRRGWVPALLFGALFAVVWLLESKPGTYVLGKDVLELGNVTIRSARRHEVVVAVQAHTPRFSAGERRIRLIETRSSWGLTSWNTERSAESVTADEARHCISTAFAPDARTEACRSLGRRLGPRADVRAAFATMVLSARD